MKTLTQLAIAATILCAVFVAVSVGIKQMMVTDGKSVFSIVLWHIPFYRTIRLPDRSMWFIARLWLVSVSIPPILWASVGLRHFLAKQNAN